MNFLDLTKFSGFYYLGLIRNLYLTHVMMGKCLRAEAKVVKPLMSFEIISFIFFVHTEDFLGQLSIEVKRAGSGIKCLSLNYECYFLSMSQLYIHRMRITTTTPYVYYDDSQINSAWHITSIHYLYCYYYHPSLVLSTASPSPGSLGQKRAAARAFPSPTGRTVTDLYLGACLQNVFISVPTTSFSSSFSLNSQVPSVTKLSQYFLFTVSPL